MKKTYIKAITREIRESFGRFTAIFAIVALGVGFLAGLLVSTPDMHASVDKYYDDNNTADIFIKGTMGLTNNDVKALSSVDKVKDIMPAYVTDTLIETDESEELSARIYGLPLDKLNKNSSGFINRLELIEGRMPQSKGECLVERSGGYLSQIKLGQKLSISKKNEDYENIDDTYSVTEYTVVGIVSNPFYFSTEREPTNIGNGRIETIVYIDESAYALDVYTDIFITIKGASELTAFTDQYENYIETIVPELESIGQIRSNIRYDEVVNEATEELNKAKAEYADKKAEAESSLSNALLEIEKGKKEIEKHEAELSDGIKKLKEGEARLANEKANYEKQIKDSEKAIKDGESQIAKSEQTLLDSKAQLDAVKSDVEQAKALLESGITLPDEVLAQIYEYDAGMEAYNLGMKKLNEKKAELEKNKELLEASKNQAQVKFAEAEEELKKVRREIADGQKQLEDARKKLADAEEEYNKAKKDAEEEFKKAEAEIADAEAEIADIEIPKWYVLDRSSNVSYVSFKTNAEKVDAIAKIFPIFFLLVAALVALTTMTRMVEEERTQIGTLKALGYTKGSIMYKYIAYCGFATILGCIVGLVSGFQLLPSVIWNVFGSMYHLPTFIAQFDWKFAITASVAAILCTIASTVSACQHELKEKPASLMLPRAPKPGKRILLEYIHPIWSRMSFTHKATARNIFRYKKHFFMTVTGVAGCTALILTGFGLRDSIGNIATTQFDEIINYDLLVRLNDDQLDNSLENLLNDKSRVSDYASFFSQTGYVRGDSKDYTVTIYVPEDQSSMGEFINFKDRKSGNKILFDNSSVIVTEKLAETLGIHVGSTITLENDDGKISDFIISGITENYLGSYVYINKTDYASAFGNNFSYNTILAKTPIDDEAEQDEMISSILNSDSVSSAEFTDQNRKSLSNLIYSIDLIVVVIIIAAGALAIIVLYNLTNININERQKELATLKVLGFHNEEVASYIFREVIILTIIGILAGLLLGVLLHGFVIKTAESPDMMFGRDISATSFLLSSVVTLLFSLVVDLIMYRKLKKIEMVDSMKAID